MLIVGSIPTRGIRRMGWHGNSKYGIGFRHSTRFLLITLLRGIQEILYEQFHQ